MTEQAPLAIIIPTRDSGRTIGQCLESVVSQVPRPAEVVIVDDVRTSDSTRQVAASFGATVHISPAGMAESRNIGVQITSGEYVLSLDSDMSMTPGLIAEIMSRFLIDKVDALSIAEAGIGRGYWARARAIDKTAVEATGWGRSIRAFTRSLFQATGGYDARLEAGEDADFHRRAIENGARIGHIGRPRILHDEGSLTLAAVFSKKYRYGKTLKAFETKHGRNTLSAGYLRRVLAGSVACVRDDPLALPGFIVLKTADATAGFLGRLDRSIPPR
jgi:glycosyltransferase involved in cell wall biosynthesis